MTSATATEPYKLMRARSGRMLGGVAAGLAKSADLDVTVVRICIGATMLSGIGIPAYILMWIVLPEESPKRGRVVEPAPENTARTIRIALVGIAVLSVLNRLGGFLSFTNPNRGFGLDGLVGLVLLGIGISILFSRHRPDRNRWDAAPPPASSRSSVAPPRPADDDSYYFDDEEEEEEPPTFAGPLSEVAQTVHGALSDAFSEVRTTLRESRPSRPARPSRPRAEDYDEYVDDYDDDLERESPRVATATGTGMSASGGFALGFARVVGWLAVIWFAIAGFALSALWCFGGVSVTSPLLLGLAAALVFVAVTNTLSHAKFARAIVPALALLLIPIGIATATVRPIGAWGYEIHHPNHVPGTTLSYRQSAGRMDIDLGKSTFKNATTTINARMGGGAIFVTVPNDAELVVHARAQAGNFSVLNVQGDGVGPRKTIKKAGCGEDPKKLVLNLRTGAGFINVERENGKLAATCAK